MMHSEDTVIFIQVPGAAGAALGGIIDREYGPLKIFAIKERRCCSEYHRLIHSDPAKLAQVSVFRGCMPFGLHRLLSRTSTYITMLCNPVDRVIAEYYSAGGAKRGQGERLPLERYLRSSETNNIATRLISGRQSRCGMMYRQCCNETFALAKENLTLHFRLIGLAERFKESLALARLAMGWKIRRYAPIALLRNGQEREQVESTGRELIAEYNRYDVALYDYALDLFSQALAAHGDRVRQALQEIARAELVGGFNRLVFRSVAGSIEACTAVNTAVRSFNMALDL